ncbi:glycosyltransferase family 87 protein [Streptomyces sp. YIM 130001]|uniref:glycosyltransferase family 87 protein n=1 Tax=Streptomyces sp. YIM 130001 TaxID=2259644 RepID=UPI000E648ADC|nr:glycosyltransferase family 87 protein [Streptomyces sp. YIM 130001]
MSPAPAEPWHLRHRVPLVATVVALPLYALWAAFLATGGGDLAAQQAWSGFVSRHPGSPYNLSWYGGLHTANYSLISPYLMAAFGVVAVTAASGIAGTWAAAALCVRSGLARPLWPALLAAFALWCNVVSGRTTFALGAALGLGTCLLLVGRHRPWWAGLLNALATLASPLAGLFLVVAGAGYLLVRDRGRAAALLLPPVLVVGATTLLFPFSGEQPMQFGRIWAPALLALAVAVLAPREWRVLRIGAAVYALGCALTYLIASPIGTNVERLAQLLAPAALLAALLAQGLRRARRTALALALVLSLGWVTDKTLDDIVVYTKVPAWARHTDGVVEALDRLDADRTRVEVVPSRDHREAAVLAPHVTLARGWNRQADVERGRLFYDGYDGTDVPRGSFTPTAYRAWLDRWAVGLVVVPDAVPDSPAWHERDLIRSRPDWLEPVWSDEHWRIYRVKDPTPLVEAPASVSRSDDSSVVVRVPESGSATVRIAYSPWLRADGGCLSRDGDFTRLTVTEPGTYRIGSSFNPAEVSASRC